MLLVAHLKSDDFFAVKTFPHAEFLATHAKPLPGAAPGAPNFQIQGDFTLRGITLPLSIPAQIAHNPANGTLAAQAAFSIDRSRWGAIYGSHKFFARLGQHFVSDDVHLQLKLSFQPQS